MRKTKSLPGRIGLGICVALALGATSAQGAAPIHSPLPGFPRFRGVALVRGSTPGIHARRRAIETALQSAASSPTPNCEQGENPGRDLCWHGGPVMREHTVHLIFWEGSSLPAGVSPFPSGYREEIETYFEDVARDSESISSVYSVGAQYGDESGESGAYKVHFDASKDVYLDTTNALPPSGVRAEERCTDPAAAAGTCVTDKNVQEEIERAAAVKVSDGWVPSSSNAYFVFTPPHAGGCFEPGGEANTSCAFATNGNGYCAYHSNFAPEGQFLYADIPDNGGVEGCDSGQHPNGAEGVDATLDVTSHEHEEMITDPTGEAWYDAIGEEAADKCIPLQAYDLSELYGPKLGGSLLGETAFNQLMQGHGYWLQMEWSNAAGEFQGGCVQRMVNTTFNPPAAPRATVPASFDGSASGTPGEPLGGGDPVLYWEWDFGDEELGGEFFSISASPLATHTYALPGTYRATLTVLDVLGNSNTTSRTVTVGEAPVPPPPPPPPPPPVPELFSTVTVTKPTPPPIRYSAAQLAAKLGLPRIGASLAGLGAIALGHAACPPACGLTLRLYTPVRKTLNGRRVTRQVAIGALHTTVASGGTGALALRLNATGRALLRRAHRLRVVLKLAVEDQQGASWKLSRELTLTGSPHGPPQ